MSARSDVEATQTQAATGVTPDTIRSTLVNELDAMQVDIEDVSGGCGQSFEALIISSRFKGLRMKDRHSLVHNTLKEEISAIHSWTQKTYTPEEWEKKKGSAQ